MRAFSKSVLGISGARRAEAIGKNEGYVSKCIAVVNLKPEVARVQDLSLRELFSLLARSEKDRMPSGAIPGGRYVSGAVNFKNKGDAFSLRLNYDASRTPKETKEKIVILLRELLAKLEDHVTDVS